MNLPEFLVEHAQNGKFSMPDESFLAEITKKSTKYLIFYNSGCVKSDYLRSNLPRTSRIIPLDLSKDWVYEIHKIYDISNIPSTVVVKNGSMKPEKTLTFNETMVFLKTL